MLPKVELLKIALAHARAGAKFLRNKRGVPVSRLDFDTDLIGLFVPASVYYTTDRVECMTTYQMRDAGFFDDEEFSFVNEIDEINTLDEGDWVEELKGKIDDERKAEG
jgi:hypothetical protein